jgi:hypothetical protein
VSPILVTIAVVFICLVLLALLNRKDQSAEKQRLRELNHMLMMENSRLQMERDAFKRYHDEVEADLKESTVVPPTP